jgi:hypothetical protein
MLVGISVNVNDDERVSGVTYGGTALTKVGERNNDNDAMVYIYSLVAPNPGTANVVITFDSALDEGAIAGVMTFTGVDQTTPLGTFASAIGNDSTPASVNISSAPGELVFAVAAAEYDAITTAPTGQDVHWNTCTSGTGNCGAGGTIAGASTRIHGHNDLGFGRGRDPQQPLGHWRGLDQTIFELRFRALHWRRRSYKF